MRHGMRWALVVALNVLAFAGVFLLFYAAEVPLLPASDDSRVAVGVAAATVAATVGGTWGAWWAPRVARAEPQQPGTGVRLELPHATVTVNGTPPEAPPQLLVRMGDLPREPVGFQPREDLLADLAGAAERHSLTVVHAVTGARGVGKTQLAAAYARRRIEEGWPVVAWITAENSGQLTSGLAELADQLGVRDAADDAATAARAALTWIGRNPDPCLVVLDNATDPDEVARWLPTAGRAQVVVTTTSHAFENLAGARVDVAVFTEEEALDFLRRRAAIASDDGARAVADELGRLPLALAQAAHVIRARGTGYQAYLERLRSYPLRSVLEKVPGERYPHRVAEAVLIAVEQAEQQAPGNAVRILLDTLAVLSAAGVPRELLHRVAKEAGIDDEVAVEDALGALTQASLATNAGADAVSVHRLVQRVVRERAGETLRPVVGAVTRGLDAFLIPVGAVWEHREVGGQLVDQIDALWSVVRADLASYDEEEQTALVRLRCWAAYDHLRHVGAMARALEWAVGTRADCLAVLDEEAPASLLALECEGDVYLASRRSEQAIVPYRRRLEIVERLKGPEHEDTRDARWDLADAYQRAGRFDLSVPTYQEVERATRLIQGPDHEDTRRALDDLANAYAAAGRRAEAVRIVERMRSDLPQSSGPSLSGLASLRSLADTYGAVGQAEEGVTLLRRHVEDCVTAHGPDAPETIWARNSLAHQCVDAHLYSEGLAAAEAALESAVRVFGPEDGDTLTVRDTLATCLQWNNRDDEAVAAFRGLVDENTDVHGPDHQLVLRARRQLVWSLTESSRILEAYEAQSALIADHTRVLGAEDPITLDTRFFHIRVCTRHGRYQQAIECARALLVDFERLCGLSDPQTLEVRLTLADALTAADEYTEAETLLRHTLRDAEQTLGSGHPKAFSARAHLARLLLEQGRATAARELREKDLDEYIRRYGDDHISVVWARSDLADVLTWCQEHDEALALHRAVVDEVTRRWGPDHPAVLLARRWLANACGEAGLYRERLRLAARAVADSEQLYGVDSALTLAARVEHVAALAATGRRREARRRTRELYEQTRRLLGDDDPSTIVRLDRVADGHRAVQRRLKALRIRRRSLDAYEAMSGPWSWNSVAARRMLGSAYCSVGLVWRAAALQKRLLDDLTEHFGPDHTAVLVQRSWWCEALRHSGRWRKALEAARDRSADYERLYGPDHPWTLNARWFVAATARRTGRVRTALTAYTTLAADRARVHGPDHLLAWNARAGHAYATLWALHPHRSVALYDVLLHEGVALFGADSRQVEQLGRRYALLCLGTGHWRRMYTALRLRRPVLPRE